MTQDEQTGLSTLRREFGVDEAPAPPKRDARPHCLSPRCSGRLQVCTKPRKHTPKHLRKAWKGGRILECDRCHMHIRHRTVAEIRDESGQLAGAA